MIDRRNFFKVAAALGLVAGLKDRQEPHREIGIDQAVWLDEQAEPSGWIVVIDEAGLDDAEVRWIVERVNLLHPVYVDLYGEESGVFPGLSHLITTGYQDADTLDYDEVPACRSAERCSTCLPLGGCPWHPRWGDTLSPEKM
jgi:hypothetical protein